MPFCKYEYKRFICITQVRKKDPPQDKVVYLFAYLYQPDNRYFIVSNK